MKMSSASLKKTVTKPTEERPASTDSQEEQEDDNTPVPEGLVRCTHCSRNFAEDRIDKHRTICIKTKLKKRKIYDASKKRVEVNLMIMTPEF